MHYICKNKKETEIFSGAKILPMVDSHPQLLYEGHPESEERFDIQSTEMFYCSRSLVSGV